MRIDVNAYLGRWNFRSKGIDDPEKLLAKEAEADVDVVIVSCPNGVATDAAFEANRALLDKIAPYRGRMFMVARVDPAWDVERTIDFLHSDAVAAIRLPATRDETLRHQERQLMEAAASLHLPVYLTLGVAHRWYAAEEMDPELVGPIVSDYPEVSFVLAGDWLFHYPKIRDAATSHKNIHLETSHNCGLRFVEKYVREFGVERVLFGTAAGILHPGLCRDKVEMSRLTSEEREAVYSGNALRIFPRLSVG